MKTYEEILTRITTLIEDISLGVNKASEIYPNARILSDLGLDSLDYASDLLDCEKWLGVKVQEEGVDWSRLATVAHLAAFMEQQQRR